MKLAFSTLGCPGWSWKEIFSCAKDLGMNGIEIRCIGNELYAPNCEEFSDSKINATLEKLSSADMSIPVLDSNAVLALPELSEASMKEAKEYIDLAAKAHIPYVRVMCIGVPQPKDCDLKLCLQLYQELCVYGEDKNVCPLLETNGPLADSGVMMRLMDLVQSSNKGVLWDIHHPYRYFDESPELTYSRIAPLLRHVHIKDSIVSEDKVCYRMLGKGDVPVKETLNLLLDNDYEGFVSLEWVKKWNPELEEAGVVLPNFAAYAKRILSAR